MSRPIVLLSGGMDSTTLLWHLQSQQPKALIFDYGQRHKKEIVHAGRICEVAGVESSIADLTGVNHLINVGSQSGREPVPEGHYAEESMKTTIVPNRNMMMISIAVAWAQATGSEEVYYAAHAGDHAIYPDCRPDFVQAMRNAVLQSSWPPYVYLRAPFIGMTKGEIVQLGLRLGVPYELTWSCYKGETRACGKCGTCRERLEAFEFAGAKDPIEYEVPVG